MTFTVTHIRTHDAAGVALRCAPRTGEYELRVVECGGRFQMYFLAALVDDPAHWCLFPSFTCALVCELGVRAHTQRNTVDSRTIPPPRL